MNQFSVIAIAAALTFCGCGTEPQFQSFGYEDREQFNADGTGFVVQQLKNQDEEIIAAIIRKQVTPNLDPNKPPGRLTIKSKSTVSMPYAKKNGKIIKSALIVDGTRQSISNGPWIFYLTDNEKFRKIHISTDLVETFRNDVARLPLDELVEKWCSQ